MPRIGLVAARRDDALLGGLQRRRLLRGIEARADQHAVGAEHQRGGEPAPIRDAARGRDRNAARRIDHRRHQRKCAARNAVAAGLGALRDQHVGALRDRLLRLLDGLHLADHQRAGRV